MRSSITNSRLDVYVDSAVLLGAWTRQHCRNVEMSSLLKDIFQLLLDCNINMSMHFVPSRQNAADLPSRSLSWQDCALSPSAWQKIESWFGPHTTDLMALDSNAKCDQHGRMLKHFTPFPTPLSDGVNVFAQDLGGERNPYAYPPFCMVFPLLRHLSQSGVRACTLVVPRLHPTPVWWPFLLSYATSLHCLGQRGDLGVIHVPSTNGLVSDAKGLRQDLLVVRCVFT